MPPLLRGFCEIVRSNRYGAIVFALQATHKAEVELWICVVLFSLRQLICALQDVSGSPHKAIAPLRLEY